MIKPVLILGGVLTLLAGCSGSGPDASGASPSEARLLNDSAAMLDANSVDADAADGGKTDQDQP